MLNLDGTLIVQLINFAIFFAVLSVVFLRPVSNAIKERRTYINSLMSDYDKYQHDAVLLRAEAENERSGARRDAVEMIAKARASASNEAAHLTADYNAKVQSTVNAAHQTVESELDAARVQEDAVVRQLADMMLDRTIGGSK
jgi:F-type H+-transporting ATPase subunit b